MHKSPVQQFSSPTHNEDDREEDKRQCRSVIHTHQKTHSELSGADTQYSSSNCHQGGSSGRSMPLPFKQGASSEQTPYQGERCHSNKTQRQRGSLCIRRPMLHSHYPDRRLLPLVVGLRSVAFIICFFLTTGKQLLPFQSLAAFGHSTYSIHLMFLAVIYTGNIPKAGAQGEVLYNLTQPTAGHALGGYFVTVVGAGFNTKSNDYSCQFSCGPKSLLSSSTTP